MPFFSYRYLEVLEGHQAKPNLCDDILPQELHGILHTGSPIAWKKDTILGEIQSDKNQ